MQAFYSVELFDDEDEDIECDDNLAGHLIIQSQQQLQKQSSLNICNNILLDGSPSSGDHSDTTSLEKNLLAVCNSLNIKCSTPLLTVDSAQEDTQVYKHDCVCENMVLLPLSSLSSL